MGRGCVVQYVSDVYWGIWCVVLGCVGVVCASGCSVVPGTVRGGVCCGVKC